MFWNRLAKWIALALVLFCSWRAITALASINMNRSSGLTGDAITVVAALGECILWGFCAALIFVVAFLPDLADKLVGELLLPRKYRKRPAPLLSPVQGMISMGRFDEARRRFAALAAEEPGCALIYSEWLRMELEECHDPAAAIRVAQDCFDGEERELSPEYYRMLRLWHALALRGDGDPEAVRQAIRRELTQHRRIYSRHERQELERLLS